jgi:hypothetical protein
MEAKKTKGIGWFGVGDLLSFFVVTVRRLGVSPRPALRSMSKMTRHPAHAVFET